MVKRMKFQCGEHCVRLVLCFMTLSKLVIVYIGLPAGSAQQDYNAIITSQLHVTCTEKETECHTLGSQYITSSFFHLIL